MSVLGPEIIYAALEKVIVIRDMLVTPCSRQKSCVDNIKRPLEFDVGDKVDLKISHIKGLIKFCR